MDLLQTYSSDALYDREECCKFCYHKVKVQGQGGITYGALWVHGGQDGTCPPKFGKKYFSGNYYVKFGHFSVKNHLKFGNFVNSSGKYHKNSGIFLIFREESCKTRAFC